LNRRQFVGITAGASVALPALAQAAGPRLRLFGGDVVAALGQSVTLDKFGGLAITGDVRLAQDGSRVTVRCKGATPAGSIDLEATFECTIAAGVLLLTAVVSSRAIIELDLPRDPNGNVPLRLPTGSMVVILNEGQRARTGEQFGIEIASIRLKSLAQVPLGVSLLEWRSEFWPQQLILTFDFFAPTTSSRDAHGALGPHAIFIPSKAPSVVAAVDDKFEGMSSVVQPLLLGLIRANAGQIRLQLDPRQRPLRLHAEILSTSRDDPRVLLHQYAAANGWLELKIVRTDAGARYGSLAWRADRENAALIVFRLRDENGNPLVFEAPFFALELRHGITGPPSDSAESERTIPAIVVSGNVEGRCRTIDPTSIKLDDWKRDAGQWLSNGRVVCGRAPLEIHGIARGVVLESRLGAMPDGVACRLETEPVKNDSEQIFSRNDLALVHGDWVLLSYLVAKNVAPSHNGQIASGHVGRREAMPLAGGDKPFLRVPFVDTSFAAANMSKGRLSAVIAKATAGWLSEIDRQFTSTHFATPQIADQQIHATGFETGPPKTSFASVIDLPPANAAIADTAVTPPVLAPKSVYYVHGGPEAGERKKAITDAIDDVAARRFEAALLAFQTIWNSADGASAQLRATLRRFLGEVRDAADDVVRAPQVAESMWERARALATGALPPGLSLSDSLRKEIATMDSAKFVAYWQQASPRPDLAALFDYLWSPGTPGTFRRLLVALQNDAALDNEIRNAKATLLQKIGFADDAKGYLERLVPGCLSETEEGLKPLYDDLVKFWGSAPELESLRQQYGRILTPDVYRALLVSPYALKLVRLYNLVHTADGALKSIPAYISEGEALYKNLERVWKEKRPEWKDDAKELWNELHQTYAKPFSGALLAEITATPPAQSVLALFQKAVPAAQVLERLADLDNSPPEYLFFTHRFPLPAVGETHFGWLWRRDFELARVAGGEKWKFLLGDDSSIIVKLTNKKTIGEILDELHESYRATDRPAPLGLDEETSHGAEPFVASLHPDLMSPEWLGVVILNPVADIGGDPTLRDLCGFQYISAKYVALGGAQPRFTDAALDVYARIQQSADHVDIPNLKGDTELTLLKFDVTIKHTQLESGEIAFRLDPKNIWGKEKNFPIINILGSLPPQREQGEPVSFHFAAVLEKPYEQTIQVAFVESISLRALRVGRSKGRTSIDIDGGLTLRSWDLQIAGFSLDFFKGVKNIGLDNFRILLPEVTAKAQRMGIPRPLQFDFPSVNFQLGQPRQFQFGGIDIKPYGMGFVRHHAEDVAVALQLLLGGYEWLEKMQIPAGEFDFPYMQFELTIGKLPLLGSEGSSFKFDMIVGAKKDGDWKLYAGLRGFDGRNVKVDLFRILVLEIAALRIGKFSTPIPERTMMGIKADDVSLKVLNWDIVPKKSLSLFFGHSNRPGTDERIESALAYAHFGNPTGFFRMHWLLLAHNLVVPNEVLNYFLSGDGDPQTMVDVIKDLVTESTSDRYAFQTTLNPSDGDEWLVGASFGIGEIIERCRFILHDHHYYGIAIASHKAFFRAIFGDDEVSLAYIPGPTREQDRFRTSFRLAIIDCLGPMECGLMALEWGVNRDFLLDFGFPWRSVGGNDWPRTFAIRGAVYETRFGVYIQRKTVTTTDSTVMELAAGVGFSLGYGFGFHSPTVWARAGIGVFAILEGIVRIELPAGGTNLLKGSIKSLTVRGMIGIFAFGEGGIDVWVLSARFRVQVQGAIMGQLDYVPNAGSVIIYEARLNAAYYASCRVGCGMFSFEFSVSGAVEIGVSGRVCLT
jgi:hypothetical protein